MKRFITGGRQAIQNDNLYVALGLALIIPDICGSLEDPQGKSQSRYRQWCSQWIVPKYTAATADPITGKPFVWMTDQQIYQLRCSLIHSGADEIDPSKRTGIDRFYFFDRTRGNDIQRFENCTFNGVTANIICLSSADFCEKMFEAAEAWDASVAGDVSIQAEKDKLLFIHSKGAIIHGITFT
jgi:hypothetical protein